MRCEKNPNHEYVETINTFIDEDGNIVEVKECLNCIEESRLAYEESRNKYRELIEQATEVDVPELIEEYGKIIESKPESGESANANGEKKTYTIIGKYSKQLHEIIGAPLEACEAIVQFDISVALHNLFFADGKGRVLPNVCLRWSCTTNVGIRAPGRSAADVMRNGRIGRGGGQGISDGEDPECAGPARSGARGNCAD